jgi:hypothetical protein
MRPHSRRYRTPVWSSSTSGPDRRRRLARVRPVGRQRDEAREWNSRSSNPGSSSRKVPSGTFRTSSHAMDRGSDRLRRSSVASSWSLPVLPKQLKASGMGTGRWSFAFPAQRPPCVLRLRRLRPAQGSSNRRIDRMGEHRDRSWARPGVRTWAPTLDVGGEDLRNMDRAGERRTPRTAQGVMTTLPTAVRSVSERSASPACSSG